MFISHKNDIPENSFEPLLQFENKKVWVNNVNPYLVSNVCTHQNSLISLSQGKGNRVCPYHGWSFATNGEPLGSGKVTYCKNTQPLLKEDLYLENGLVLNKKIDLSKYLKGLGIEDLELVEKRVDKVLASPEKIMDLFLDVDHIPIVHKGVYDRIGLSNIPNNLVWDYHEWGSVQVVFQEQTPSALWISIYPNTMIEYQKGDLFVTVAIDKSHGSDVLVYKYKNKNTECSWKLNESVWEESWEQDKSQAEIITELPTFNLEESKIHFRNWMKLNRGKI